MRGKAQTRDFPLHVRPFGDSRFPADPLLGTKPYNISLTRCLVQGSALSQIQVNCNHTAAAGHFILIFPAVDVTLSISRHPSGKKSLSRIFSRSFYPFASTRAVSPSFRGTVQKLQPRITLIVSWTAHLCSPLTKRVL